MRCLFADGYRDGAAATWLLFMAAILSKISTTLGRAHEPTPNPSQEGN